MGIDLAKNTLQLYGENSASQKVLQKNMPRGKVLAFTANLAPCEICMESCGGSHYWGREFEKQGHRVKLIPAQYVKPFVKTHKNDRIDAEAICEAGGRPNMRTVPIKTIEQHDVQSLHRVRQNVTKNRTALANQIRGLLGECGIVIPKGMRSLFLQLPLILEDAENGLSSMMRELINEQHEELKRIDERFDELTDRIGTFANQHPLCRRLLTVEGIGPLTATAMYAAVGNGSQFRRGRDMSAWLGVVPQQYSTGGKSRLGKISKRGNTYLRSLLVGGARAVVQYADKKDTRQSQWVRNHKEKKGYNIAVVALVNKTVRIAWAVLTKGEDYDPAQQENLARQYEKKAA